MIKNPPAVQENQVQSLGQEDPLKKEMATHSNIPTWDIPWTEKPGGLKSMGHKESNTTEQLYFLLVQGFQRDLGFEIFICMTQRSSSDPFGFIPS